MMTDEQNTPHTSAPSNPPETEPAADSAQPKPDAPKAPYVYPPIPPIRRVGTLTMGFALVVTGIVALLATFWNGFDAITVLKLSPVLFIFLGLEILFSHLRHPDKRMRFDFFSGFICFLLVCGGLFCAFIPTVWGYVGPESWQVRSDLRFAVEQELAERLQDKAPISNLSVNADIPYPIKIDPNLPAVEYLPHTTANLTIGFKGPYADADAFARDCAKTLDALHQTPYRIDWINLYYREDGSDIYRIHFGGRYWMNLDAASIANEVDDMREEHALDQRRQQLEQEYESRYEEIEARREQQDQDLEARINELEQNLEARSDEVDQRATELDEREADLREREALLAQSSVPLA